MYCKKCGNEISDGAKFCKFCGAVQETQAAGSFQKPQNVDPVKEAEQQRQRERLDQQIVSLESERKALEEKIKEDRVRKWCCQQRTCSRKSVRIAEEW